MTCMPPNTVKDSIVVEIADKQSVVNQINTEVFDKVNLEAGTGIAAPEKSDDTISSMLEGNGLIIGLFFVFLGGLALNLTPCVYPLIPITIGFFGGQSEGKTSRLVGMGLLFVVGMAVTYSVIGVITASNRISIRSPASKPDSNNPDRPYFYSSFAKHVRRLRIQAA